MLWQPQLETAPAPCPPPADEAAADWPWVGGQRSCSPRLSGLQVEANPSSLDQAPDAFLRVPIPA